MDINKTFTIKLYVTAFFGGLATMAYEMLLGRALVPYFGGTIYIWGALISIFLLGMSLGFIGGGKLSVRQPDASWLAVFLVTGGIAIIITPIFLAPVCLFLLQHFQDVRVLAVITAIIFAFLPAALYAAISPFCVRLALHQVTEAGIISGRFSALNTIGSIVGTLGTSFFLLPYLGSKLVFFLLGTASIVLAPVIVPQADSIFPKNPLFRKLLYAALIILALLSAVILTMNYMVKTMIIDSAESEYNNIFILQDGNYRMMKFGYPTRPNTESAIDVTDPKKLVFDYVRAMVVGAMYPKQLTRVAMVGLGGGQLPSYLTKTVTSLNADVAEIDKEVVRLASQYFNTKETNRLKIYPEDGRLFLARTPNKYDVIFLDAYRTGFVPFHLLTKEFFELIRSKLTPSGVVVQNVEPTTLLLDGVVATMRSVFTQVDMYKANKNIVLVGYMGDKLPLEQLGKKAVQFNERYHPYHNPFDIINTQVEIPIDPKAKVLTDDFAPVEMLNAVKRHNAPR